MPFANEHAARQSDPDKYRRFARQHPKGWPAGVDAIFGVDGEGKSHLQSVRFKRAQWTTQRAQSWLQDHSLSASVDEAREDSLDVEYGDKCALYGDGSCARFDEGDVPEGEIVQRYDYSDLASPTRTKDGFLRGQGLITRSGVFAYKQADGNTLREFHPPDAVFDPQSLASYNLMPLTLGHPRTAGGETMYLNPTNARQHAIGSVGAASRVGDHARADILITDEAAIRAAESGQNKLSSGYSARRVPRGGTYVRADGIEEPFDAVVFGYENNHVALVHAARAGGAAQMRVDSADSVLCESTEPGRTEPTEPDGVPPATGETKVKITIEGKEHEVPDAVAAELRKLAESGLATAQKAVQAQAEADKASAQVAALQLEAQKRTAAAQDEQKINAKIELAMKSAAILDKPIAEVVRMDDAEIILEVLKKEAPKLDLTGKSADYKRALFDHLTANRVNTTEELNKITGEVRRADAQDDPMKKIREARQKMIDDQANAWKKTA